MNNLDCLYALSVPQIRSFLKLENPLGVYIAIPQSMTIFWPVMDLLRTKVLIWSATSSGVAVPLRADLSTVAFTLDSGNWLPLVDRGRSAKIRRGWKYVTHHSVIINPGLTLLHLTFLPQIIASPFVR